jgi:hypothetical protein
MLGRAAPPDAYIRGLTVQTTILMHATTFTANHQSLTLPQSAGLAYLTSPPSPRLDHPEQENPQLQPVPGERKRHIWACTRSNASQLLNRRFSQWVHRGRCRSRIPDQGFEGQGRHRRRRRDDRRSRGGGGIGVQQ